MIIQNQNDTEEKHFGLGKKSQVAPYEEDIKCGSVGTMDDK